MAKYIKSNEFFVALTIILLSAVIGSRSNAYFTLANGIDTIRSVVVSGIFALGVYMTIVSGGIDVSFPAIASLSMFATTKVLVSINYTGPVIVIFIIGGLIGLFLGLINAVIISYYKLPTLIVTLGTSSIFSGFCLAFLGAKAISNLPKPMDDFSKLNIFKFITKDGITVGLPSSLLILVLFSVVVFFVMNYTLLGRGIFAIGGDGISAERVGFNIHKIQFFIYGFVGLMSGVAGITYACMMRESNPVELLGSELSIIAAVVLGGTRISGGHGTIAGTFLGLLLISIIKNNLILMGVSTYWQTFTIGLMILLGTGITAYQVMKTKDKINNELSD